MNNLGLIIIFIANYVKKVFEGCNRLNSSYKLDII